METVTRTEKSKVKKILKRVGIGAGAIVILLTGSVWGAWSEEVVIQDKLYYKDEVYAEIERLDKEKNTLSKDVKTLQGEKKEAQSVIDKRDKASEELKKLEAKLADKQKALDTELAEGRKKIEAELATLNAEIQKKKDEIASLDSQIASKQAELDAIIGGIKEKKEAPIVLPAGQFIVGKDIPAGRYKVTTNGSRGSNFQVYDSSGSIVINTIISSRDGHGVKEYIALIGDGYIIDAHDSFKYIPVE